MLPGMVCPSAPCCQGQCAPAHPATGDGAPRHTLPLGTVCPGAPCYWGRCPWCTQLWGEVCPSAPCYRGRCAPTHPATREGAPQRTLLPGMVHPGAPLRTLLPGKAALATSLVHCYRGRMLQRAAMWAAARDKAAQLTAMRAPAHVSSLQACISANPAPVGHSPTHSADPSLLLTSIIWADVGCLMVDELIPSGLLQYYWVRSPICPAHRRKLGRWSWRI